MFDPELNHKIRRAIDDVDSSVRINGKQSDITDHLVNYLTANIDDIAEAIAEEDECDDPCQCRFCGNDHQDCTCGH